MRISEAELCINKNRINENEINVGAFLIGFCSFQKHCSK